MRAFQGTRPQRGKSAVMACLLANLNVAAADVAQGFTEPVEHLLHCVSGLGEASEKQTVVPIRHAGDADEAQPVGGVLAIQDGAGGMSAPAAAQQGFKDAEAFGVAGDLGVVAELHNLADGEEEHAGESEPAAEVCKAPLMAHGTQPEGAGRKAALAA